MIPFPAKTCASRFQREQSIPARQFETAGWGGDEKLEICCPGVPGPEFLPPALKFQVVRGVAW